LTWETPRSEPPQPIAWLAAMMGNGQDLHHSCGFAVDQIKRENLETQAADIRCAHYPMSPRGCAGRRQHGLEFGVIAPAEPRLLLLVIGDLLSMLRRCPRVQLVDHLYSA